MEQNMRQIEQILLSGKENAYLYIKVYTVFWKNLGTSFEIHKNAR